MLNFTAKTWSSSSFLLQIFNFWICNSSWIGPKMWGLIHFPLAYLETSKNQVKYLLILSHDLPDPGRLEVDGEARQEVRI